MGSRLRRGVTEVEPGAEELKNQAPDFTLLDFDGNLVKLSDFRGKPVFIDFWAAWCPFCTDEMPEIESLHKEFGDRVVIIGIQRTNTESLQAGKDYAKNTVGVTYLLLQDKTGEVYRAYTKDTFAGMPVAAWIDKDGVLVKTKVGPKTEEELRSNLLEVLEK
ncbi:MAG TPA: TlpA family protein disulfide reductase [candidate division WWE3 bacterium]|uniref:TlpA family protein disulfide reductase n=1 Tax=candidate division WWE3 bacterium TaxID=2053526 RepID=A0A7C1SXK2_UNCKA|nr:TlpA family protein disulfide reductase [candidate division WWE3 bacterium]